MSGKTQRERRYRPINPLLSSLWRDEHGHTYRVVSIVGSGSENPSLTLRYVPPPTTKRLSLRELHATHEEEAVARV
jgi:hypothetical protein